MKIVHIVTSLGIGGAERVVLELATELSNLNYQISVISINDDCRILDQYPHINFKTHNLNIKKYNFFTFFSALFSLINFVRKEKADIIHAHMFHSLIAGLVCCLFFPKTKLVFTSHNFSGFSLARKTFIRWTKKFRKADIVFTKEQHISLNAKRTWIIPNGVVVNRSQKTRSFSKTKPTIFVSVGRLEEQKDPFALIGAFHTMKNKNCELWFAGDGSLLEKMREKILSLHLEKRIKLLGAQKKIHKIYEKADCFVMTSKWEGLPLALLEAGARGLPIIATPVGAIPVVLSEKTGYLTPVKDFAKAMDHVIDHYEDAVAKGVHLQELIKQYYSLDNMIHQHQKLYSHLIHKKML